METVSCFDETLHTQEEDCAFYREKVFPECTILGAFEKDVLVGHAAWRPGWIDHLYVDPERHSQGIGARLLAQIQATLDDIQLWTFQANEGACRFYERHGFVAEEYTDGAQNEEKEPDVRYRWRRRSGSA